MTDKGTNIFDFLKASVPVFLLIFTSIMTALDKLEGNLFNIAWLVTIVGVLAVIGWFLHKSVVKKAVAKNEIECRELIANIEAEHKEKLREADLLWKRILDERGIDLHRQIVQSLEFSKSVVFVGHPSRVRYTDLISHAEYEFEYKINKVKESLFRDIMVNILKLYAIITEEYFDSLITVYEADGEIDDNLLRMITSATYKTLGDEISHYYKRVDRDYTDDEKITLKKALTLVLKIRNAVSGFVKRSLDDVVMDNKLYGDLGFKVSNILDKFLSEACFLKVTIEGEIENINGELSDCIWEGKKVGR